MTKAAMEHMTRYLACEWGADGIRVNAVAPWFIKTPLTEPLLAHEPFHAAVRAATPLRRVGEPHEVACTVAFLAMDAAAYITGQVVGIDGGMMQVGFKYTGE
jgi:Tropinone reductase 1